MNSYTRLPTTVEDYFTSIDSDHPEQTIDSFSDDARVVDDAHTYRGRDEILAWLTGAATEYITTSARLSAQVTAHTITVVNRVSGNFPGGQVDLRHEFTLDAHGLIEQLTIAA